MIDIVSAQTSAVCELFHIWGVFRNRLTLLWIIWTHRFEISSAS
jgi:hypothetical protein